MMTLTMALRMTTMTLTYIEDVDDGVENDDDDLGILDLQQVAQRLEYTDRHDVADLRRAAT